MQANKGWTVERAAAAMAIAGLALCIAAWLKPQAADTRTSGASRSQMFGDGSPVEAASTPNDVFDVGVAPSFANTRPAGMLDRGRLTEKPLGHAQIDSALLKELKPTGGKAVRQTVSFAADFDGDGKLDDIDLTAYAEAFDLGDQRADLNSDGVVDGDDFALFADNFDARTEVTRVIAATEFQILITPVITSGAPTTGNRLQTHGKALGKTVELELTTRRLANEDLLIYAESN